MGDIFDNIVFKQHRLHDDGVHGFYHLSDDRYVSVCSGGGSYGKLDKVDYWILVTNKHKGWSNNINSTFEVAYVDKLKGELLDGPNGETIKGECSVDYVEDFIKKIKQEYTFVVD